MGGVGEGDERIEIHLLLRWFFVFGMFGDDTVRRTWLEAPRDLALLYPGSLVKSQAITRHKKPSLVARFFVAPGRGFEPRYAASKAAVLPLDDPGTSGAILSYRS